MMTGNYKWIRVIMNLMKSVLYALIALVVLQNNHLCGMFGFRHVLLRNDSYKLLEESSDIKRQANIAYLTKKYNLPLEQKLKLRKTKITMDHSTLVIPPFKNNKKNQQVNSVRQRPLVLPVQGIKHYIDYKNSRPKMKVVVFSGDGVIDKQLPEKIIKSPRTSTYSDLAKKLVRSK